MLWNPAEIYSFYQLPGNNIKHMTNTFNMKVIFPLTYI